jgi:hypothetical protein
MTSVMVNSMKMASKSILRDMTSDSRRDSGHRKTRRVRCQFSIAVGGVEMGQASERDGRCRPLPVRTDGAFLPVEAATHFINTSTNTSRQSYTCRKWPRARTDLHAAASPMLPRFRN